MPLMEVILSVRGIVTSQNAHFISICIESFSSPVVHIILPNNVNVISDRIETMKMIKPMTCTPKS